MSIAGLFYEQPLNPAGGMCYGFTIRCSFSISISFVSISTRLSSERSVPPRHDGCRYTYRNDNKRHEDINHPVIR